MLKKIWNKHQKLGLSLAIKNTYISLNILMIDLPGIFVFAVVVGVVWAILKVGNVLIGGGGGGIGIFVACDC